jgi:hypothetical protein
LDRFFQGVLPLRADTSLSSLLALHELISRRLCESVFPPANVTEQAHVNGLRNDKRSWNYGRKNDPTQRHVIFRSVYQLLEVLDEDERKKRFAGLGSMGLFGCCGSPYALGALSA